MELMCQLCTHGFVCEMQCDRISRMISTCSTEDLVMCKHYSVVLTYYVIPIKVSEYKVTSVEQETELIPQSVLFLTILPSPYFMKLHALPLFLLSVHSYAPWSQYVGCLSAVCWINVKRISVAKSVWPTSLHLDYVHRSLYTHKETWYWPITMSLWVVIHMFSYYSPPRCTQDFRMGVSDPICMHSVQWNFKTMPTIIWNSTHIGMYAVSVGGVTALLAAMVADWRSLTD